MSIVGPCLLPLSVFFIWPRCPGGGKRAGAGIQSAVCQGSQAEEQPRPSHITSLNRCFWRQLGDSFLLRHGEKVKKRQFLMYVFFSLLASLAAKRLGQRALLS